MTSKARVPENESMDEPIFDTIKRRLKESRGHCTWIAKESGVNIWTIRNILDGRSPNPGVQTCQKLLDYFRARDEKIAKLQKRQESRA